jgi:hypothetical protein
MIGFIGTSLQLHSIITPHNQWLYKTRSIPHWTMSAFPSAVMNDERRITTHTLNSLVRVRARVALRLAVYRQSFRLDDKPLETQTSNLIFNWRWESLCKILPEERIGLSFQLLLTLASAVILGSESRGTYNYILLSQIRDSPKPENQVLVFISPGNRVTQLHDSFIISRRP